MQPGGWAAWTRHRLSATSPRPLSPLDLVQVTAEGAARPPACLPAYIQPLTPALPDPVLSPASAHPAVQEHYQECPWQHIVACLLCSRTTGGPAVRDAIRRFLHLFPTPSAVLDAPEAR